jgi:hypothetical protein
MIPVGILTAQATSSFSFLLDLYPSAYCAYSFRKLSSTYTGSCIRVRRSSDNTESDIGFVNNVLDTTTLTTFCGAGNGFIKKWYDQSGNVRDQTQNANGNQPQIVSSGSVILVNGKPSYSLNGTGQYIDATINLTSSNLSIFEVFKINDNNFIVNYGGGSSFIMLGLTTSNVADSIVVNSRYKNNVSLTTSNSLDVASNYGNNTQILSSGFYGAVASWGGTGFANSTAYPILGNCQEIIFYSNNQSANNSGINSNINSFYTIY